MDLAKRLLTEESMRQILLHLPDFWNSLLIFSDI